MKFNKILKINFLIPIFLIVSIFMVVIPSYTKVMSKYDRVDPKDAFGSFFNYTSLYLPYNSLIEEGKVNRDVIDDTKGSFTAKQFKVSVKSLFYMPEITYTIYNANYLIDSLNTFNPGRLEFKIFTDKRKERVIVNKYGGVDIQALTWDGSLWVSMARVKPPVAYDSAGNKLTTYYEVKDKDTFVQRTELNPLTAYPIKIHTDFDEDFEGDIKMTWSTTPPKPKKA